MFCEFAKVLGELWRAIFDAYQPELRYMRGPGPKWHAKYGSLINKTSRSASPSRPIASDIAEHRA